MPGLQYPEAFKSMAENELGHAFWLSQCVQAIEIEIKRDIWDMPKDNLAKRRALLGVAKEILAKARDKAMEEATWLWQDRSKQEK